MQDHTLLMIVKYLKEKYDCHTIILYGSRARNDSNDLSDYDILAIRDTGEMERDCSTFDSFFLDAFIYATAAIKNPDESFLRIKDGVVVCQKDNVGEELLAAVRKMFAAGPKPIPHWEKRLIITWHNKMYARALKGDIEGNFRMLWLLYDLLESYFKLRDRWYLGPKESFQFLKINDIQTYVLFDNALKNPFQLDNVKKLIERVTG